MMKFLKFCFLAWYDFDILEDIALTLNTWHLILVFTSHTLFKINSIERDFTGLS